MQTYDVIVIGVGAMGSSACYQLARRGVRVLGLDQFDIPGNKGSSHGESRMIRTAYYEHPDYVPLLQRAWSLWRELENEAGEQILHQTGGLYLGPPAGDLIAGSLNSSRKHGLVHELLSADEVHRRYPQFRFPPHWVGLLEHQAGLLRPERAIRAHAKLAANHGAEIHSNEPVLSWQSGPQGATVTTSKATYAAGELVVTAGAWSDRLLHGVVPTLKVTRQVLGWVKPLRPELFGLGTLPVWAADNGDGTIHYGFPILDGAKGMKFAHHAPGELTDPDTIDRTARPKDEQAFRPALRRLMPDGDGPLTAMEICMYTCSPDHHFILDRSTTDAHVTIACGFSGHGFKFASVIGEALADLAMEKHSTLPINFLSLKRFS